MAGAVACGVWFVALACGVRVDRSLCAFQDRVSVRKQQMTVVFGGLTVVFGVGFVV